MHHEFQKFTTYVLPCERGATSIGLPSSVVRSNVGRGLVLLHEPRHRRLAAVLHREHDAERDEHDADRERDPADRDAASRRDLGQRARFVVVAAARLGDRRAGATARASA